jgi:hypothetical protein
MTQPYWLAPILTHKYKTKVNVSDSGKHSSLLRYGKKYSRKKFYSKGPERNLLKTTYIRLGSKISQGPKTLVYLSIVAMVIKKFYKNGTWKIKENLF